MAKSRAFFLDSNGWVALLNKADSLHPRADAVWTQLIREGRTIILTDWIVAETGNGIARTPSRPDFAVAARRMFRSPRSLIIPIGPVLMDRALTLYEERRDKIWGLVDCASFIVMQDEGISEAFTTDRHFEQAGFICLLPASAT